MSNEDENLLAILGPTNTGKTYSAFEKLFSYSSGIFGFPLRLLARENYDKAVKRIGLSKVALVTGEEKILPKEVSLAMPISGGSKFNENFELQGYIKFYKDRYFHLHTNLWLSIFKDSSKNTNFMNDFENNKNISLW